MEWEQSSASCAWPSARVASVMWKGRTIGPPIYRHRHPWSHRLSLTWHRLHHHKCKSRFRPARWRWRFALKVIFMSRSRLMGAGKWWALTDGAGFRGAWIRIGALMLTDNGNGLTPAGTGPA